MKTLFATGLAVLALNQAIGQISMDLSLDQDQFLPNESIRVAVKITNTSGQPIHLGADPKWLTFSMEAADGTVVVKNGEVPVVEEFDLESSQMATKHVNLQPYFQLSRPDRYKIIATMRVKEWRLTVNSAPIHLDIIQGVELWSQNFGVAAAAAGEPPESRRYALIKASYLQKQLRLYLQVASNDSQSILKVVALGPLVSFSAPEEQVDRSSQLHVLWQTGAQSFSYIVINPGGTVISRDIYDNFNARPRLAVNENGEVIVKSGVRRPTSESVPLVRAPDISPVPPGKP